ncbi:LysM peptidoglycan-binding domain-containing protein [Bacillus sp. FJAT-29814]|uniref:C40 family peptidase n=1 Tax=Bacillus sp. FJAT-29814 TaxID=1729688 RepID=UPI00082D3670|nr:LysM peptidoglycan-binding domain-containing protein [Bacillus sp. FJAT-29814]
MENIQRYEIKKIAPNRDEFEFILHLDGQFSEFATELGTVPSEKKDITALAKQIIKDKYPYLKVTAIKVILGGVAITTIPLTTHSSTAHAEGSNGSSPAQTAQADSIYYHVLSGDTLWGISKKFGITVDDIKRANLLTTDILKVNQLLIIPKAFHTVGTGDYLTVLAKKYGTTVAGIKQVNNLNSDATIIGQTLIIPMLIGGGTNNGQAQSAVQTPPQDLTASTHTVVAGDTLWGISARYKIDVDTLRKANQLQSDMLHIGQTLIIPTTQTGEATTAIPSEPAKTTGMEYTVVAGDTLWGISARYKIDVDTLRKANQLQSDMLHIDQTLIIPTTQTGEATPTVPSEPAKTTGTEYTVVPGDSLSVIAKRSNISVELLKQANQLTSDFIKVGQVLKIPTASVVSAPTPVTTATPDPAPASAPDQELAAVQKNLQILGYNSVPAMTGRYDDPTTESIKNFQAAYGIPITGKLNEATNTAINHAVVKKKLIQDTTNYLGVPYLWGGVTPKGFDCSGFVYYMFNQHGVKMPRNTSAGLYQTGTSIDRARLQPGDLVFFAVNTPGTVSHVGFYIGNNQFVSATNSKGIDIQPLDVGYWAKYYVGAKRVY